MMRWICFAFVQTEQKVIVQMNDGSYSPDTETLNECLRDFICILHDTLHTQEDEVNDILVQQRNLINLHCLT
jgi:hypothetical protein